MECKRDTEIFSPGTGKARGVCILFCFVKCVLVNIYAPHTGQAAFLTPLCPLYSKFTDLPTMVVVGDFNLVPEPELNRSSPLPFHRSLSSSLVLFMFGIWLSGVPFLLKTP